ncbi:hypothetical protein [Streptomyces sp. N35]|uniref:hypothetical protein n=1 Tax=Streptomyces sp. N35 TaxID=2795730 RepID=UPI0018F77FFE|nr:hypothetical protein [Streptomyces sp. N35]
MITTLAAASLAVTLLQAPATAQPEGGDPGGAVTKSEAVNAQAAPAPYEMPTYDPAPRTRAEEPPPRPEPESYEDFRPGLRRLLEDLRSGRLNEEAFVNHAYAKLGYQGGVPKHYRDDQLPAEQRVILGMTLGRELAGLGHPVRRSIQNRMAQADILRPLTTRRAENPAALAVPLSECGQRGKLPGVFDCLHQSANFSVFYNAAGDNAVNPYDGPGTAAQGDVQDNGVPNYVERMTRSLEEGRKTYSSLGYAPREDHDKKVTLFLGSTHVEPGVGFVQPYELADANIIHIGTDFDSSDEAEEFYLPRHELFHSMQYKYVGWSLIWNMRSLNAWMEATAEWGAHQAVAADPAVPYGSRYIYANDLDEFLARPEEELTKQDGFGGGRQYGAFIFAEFLDERFGADAVRHSWERIEDAWFPDGATEIRDMITDDYDRDVHEEFRVFGVANYQLCGGSTAADYGSYWRYQDGDADDWCGALGTTGADGPLAVARPEHETITLPADGKASGQWTVKGGGVHYVDLVGQADPSKLWNMAVRTMQDDDKRLTFTVVNWEKIPRRCFADDKSAREQDKTLDTRIGGSCNVVTLMISHGRPGDDEEEGRWETKYTSLFGGSVGSTDVQIGVQPGGNLITPGGTPSTGTKTTEVGLRHRPTNYEAVSAVACHCEGWGIQVTPPGGVGQWSGWSHGVQGLSENAEITEFTTTPTTAKSTVRLVGTDYPVYVTHEYRPSARPELYDVTVTVTSLAPPGDQPHISYRRVVDWDVEPTPLKEYVTLKADHPKVEFASDYGLAGPDPGSGRPKLHHEGSFTDAGPYDQGTVLDVNVPVEPVPGNPDAGLVGEFHLYYGAAATEAKALEALNAVNAPVYSLAKPSTPGNPGSGAPATFVLGYRPVT